MSLRVGNFCDLIFWSWKTLWSCPRMEWWYPWNPKTTWTSYCKMLQDVASMSVQICQEIRGHLSHYMGREETYLSRMSPMSKWSLELWHCFKGLESRRVAKYFTRASSWQMRTWAKCVVRNMVCSVHTKKYVRSIYIYNIYIHRHIIYNYHLYCIIISKILYDSCMYVLYYIELPYTDQHARS